MSIALDVAIGVVFLYLLLALIVTTVQELLASVFRFRAKHLFHAIAGMLGDNGSAEGARLAQALYEHPLVRNLAKQPLGIKDGKLARFGKGLPSYIPSRTFVIALLDVLRQERTTTEAMGATRLLAQADELIGTLPPGNMKQALELLVSDARDASASLDERAKLVSDRLETWFNDRMARASGWYKRNAQMWSLALAAVVTLAANADSIHVVNRLWNDATLRAAVVTSAQGFADSQSPPATAAKLAATGSAGSPDASDASNSARELEARALRQASDIENAGLPIGWKWELESPSLLPCARLESDQDRNHGAGASSDARPQCWQPMTRDYVFLGAGWLITTLAVSLGAAFWFDVLSKALQLRGSGPRVSVASGRIESE